MSELNISTTPQNLGGVKLKANKSKMDPLDYLNSLVWNKWKNCYTDKEEYDKDFKLNKILDKMESVGYNRTMQTYHALKSNCGRKNIDIEDYLENMVYNPYTGEPINKENLEISKYNKESRSYE